jgi:hypothetical protein
MEARRGPSAGTVLVGLICGSLLVSGLAIVALGVAGLVTWLLEPGGPSTQELTGLPLAFGALALAFGSLLTFFGTVLALGWRKGSVDYAAARQQTRPVAVTGGVDLQGRWAAVLLAGAALGYLLALYVGTLPGTFDVYNRTAEIDRRMYFSIALVGLSLVAGTVGVAKLPKGETRTIAAILVTLAWIFALGLGALISIGAAIG